VLVQLLNPPPSSWHSNVLEGLLEVKANVAPVRLVGFGGPWLTVTTGAAVSTDHE